MYKGHPAIGSQTGFCLDRWMVWHDIRGCTAIWAEDASWNKWEGQAEKSTQRKADQHTIHVRTDHTDHTNGKIANTKSFLVLLVIARISATIDPVRCNCFLLLRLILREGNKWHSLFPTFMYIWVFQRLRESVATYS